MAGDRLRQDDGGGRLAGARLAIAAVVAALAQVTVAARLPVTPDLGLLVAVVAGLRYGPVAGAATGFAAGLAADLVPPALPPAGRTALVLCLVGYACGRARLPVPAALPLGVLGGWLLSSCAGGLLAGLGAGSAAPDLPPGGASLTGALLSGLTGALPYDLPASLLLAPIAWLAITWERIPLTRLTDATPLSFTAPAGAPARGLALPRPARPPLAGAGAGRRPSRPRRNGRARAAYRRARRARAYRR
jgi:hypothetical protein